MPINPDRILFRDDWFLAVNKLSGELVVKGKGEVGKLPLLDFLRKEEPGLAPVHRLDFETSGVVLFARTKEALHRAMEAQKGGGWRKAYRTLVMGRIPKDKGEIAIQLPARTKDKKVSALTRFTVLERFANSSYVEAVIEKGRHHQIRRHFSLMKHPLVLDAVYGHEKFNRVFHREFGYGKFFLHAFTLSFKHPFTEKNMVIEAPMPRSFLEVLESLREVSR